MKSIVSILIQSLIIFQYHGLYSQQWLEAKHVGGPLWDAISSVITDNKANVYIGGDFNKIGFFDSDTVYSNGYSDYFLIKYDSTGKILWLKNGGGTGTSMQSVDYISDILILDTNVFVIGSFNGSTSFGNFHLSCDGIGNAFVARYTTKGDCLWARKIGGSDFDEAWRIVTDENGMLYVAGISISPTLHTQNLSVDINNQMFFIAKLDYDGNFKWLQSVGGTGWFQISDMKFYNKAIYLTGGFNNDISFGQVSYFTEKDFLPCITKLDTSGNGIWGYSIDCENYGYISALCISGDDHLYCAGVTDGAMIISMDTIRNSGFIFKADMTGNVIWLRPMGQEPNCVISTNRNEIITIGTFSKTQNFSNCKMISTSKYYSMFVAKVNADGECTGSIKVGNVDYIGNCSLGADNNLYIAGSCHATSFGNINIGNYGNVDGFWAKLDYVSWFEDDEPDNNSLYIYANPNPGIFNLKVPEKVMNEMGVVFKIYDNTGRLVKEQKLDLLDKTIHLNIENSASGIYYLQLICKYDIYYGKMVVR